MLYPLAGGLAGYAGAKVMGVANVLALFGIAVLTMIIVSIAGFILKRRSEGS